MREVLLWGKEEWMPRGLLLRNEPLFIHRGPGLLFTCIRFLLYLHHPIRQILHMS